MKILVAILVVLALLLWAALVWFALPLVGVAEVLPFEPIWVRLLMIGVVWFIVGLIGLIRFLRRRAAAKALEEAMAEEEVTGDGEELAERMTEALQVLKKSSGSKSFLYDLPWYVIVGPPGAGKTTALKNSGIKFPLDEQGKGLAQRGVGGTRFVEWMFAEDAVLIDTAGRYTTQESSEGEDNAGWLGFLKILKKHRKRQPINGAMIAISLSDLSMQDETTQKSHAAAIRRRLHELREKLGVRFPVYVLFTKSDLIAGFSEFFDHLGKEDREQVWGFTLSIPKKQKGEFSPMQGFDAEFDGLLQQVNAQSLERMQQETDHQRRSLISNFPAQFASVRATAKAFLDEVFQDNRFEKRQLLRGVYFTSGTQEGTPIDRLMMGMAQTFGIGRQAIGSGRGSGRSFFLTRLFENVAFKEAGLVSADDRVERRYRWTKRIAITAALIGGVALSGLWARSYLGNTDLLAQTETSIGAYRAAASQIPASPIEDSDLPSVVPALNILRDLPGNPALTDPEPPTELQYGLYQGKVLGNQAAQTYRRALNEVYLPRLLLRLEEQLQANLNNPDFLYEVLKVYLMLGQQGPMDKSLVKEWMDLDWSVAFPGDARIELRSDLYEHLEVLLDAPMDDIGLNGPLVEQIQGLLSEMPLAQRIYNGIINSPRAQELPKFRLTNAGGPAVSRVMVRASGKPLNDGIDGIFTRRGFYEVFVDEAARAAFRLKNEAWVLGPDFTSGQAADILPVQRDVLQLYYADYIARYDALLSDINIVPLENASQATEVTNVLSGPVSPIVNILTEVSAETRLTGSDTVVNTSGLQEGLSSAASLEINSLLSVQGQALLASIQQAPLFGEEGQTPPPVGYEVEEAFSWLQQLTFREDNQPSQLDLLMDQLKVLNQELSKMVFSGNSSATPEATAAIQQFQAAAAQFDGPLPRWANQVSVGSTGIASTGTRASINQRWQTSILPFCQQALTSRYPFDRRARADVAMQDFQRLFAPNGMIDSFFKESLATYVDVSQPEWVSKRVNNTDLGLSPEALKQMQRAAAIRDAFFFGGEVPAIRFQMTPEALTPQAQRVALDIDGQAVEFNQGSQPSPQSVTWPGTVGVARISFEPLATNVESSFGRDGPWAWFRLLDAAEVRKTNVSDRRRVIFNVGGRIAIFQLQTPSTLNPFALPALNNFSCPESF